MVAAGILLSRIVGLVRNRVFAHYFGTSDAADAFNAAFRIPNFLQNLFGEGVLSASFIPVYAGLLARGDEDEAGRVAGAVAALLALVTAVLVLLGVLLTPWLIAIIAPGFDGEKREVTIRLVRILFPGAGCWCSRPGAWACSTATGASSCRYAAPVLWNLAIIAQPDRLRRPALGGYAWRRSRRGARWSGSLLQFGVQLPTVLAAARRACAAASTAAPSAGARGAAQLRPGVRGPRASCRSAPTSTPCSRACCPPAPWPGSRYAQVLYTLPVSLFGMSVSAAELPAMASASGNEAERAALPARAARRGPAPDRVLRRALRDGLPRARRRRGRRAVSVGRVHPRDDGLRLGHPGRLRGRAAGVDDGPALRLHLLRAARHPHAAPLRGWCGSPSPSGWATSSRSRCRVLLGIDPRWGAAGLTASAGIAGLDRVRPAARRA